MSFNIQEELESSLKIIEKYQKEYDSLPLFLKKASDIMSANCDEDLQYYIDKHASDDEDVQDMLQAAIDIAQSKIHKTPINDMNAALKLKNTFEQAGQMRIAGIMGRIIDRSHEHSLEKTLEV